MNQPLLKKFLPVLIAFLLVNLLIFIFKQPLIRTGFTINFLLIANTILFLLSFFGFFIQTRSVNSSNIHAFIRGIYLTLLLKMFVIIGAIVLYIYAMGGVVNEPSLFTAMVLYLLYTSIEVSQLTKIARRKKNDRKEL